MSTVFTNGTSHRQYIKAPDGRHVLWVDTRIDGRKEARVPGPEGQAPALTEPFDYEEIRPQLEALLNDKIVFKT